MTTIVHGQGTPVIYANINYRVGPMGFPVGEIASREGIQNLGLRDQLLAFEWIHDNIERFGGDRTKVCSFAIVQYSCT